MSTHESDNSRIAWAHRSGAETARLAWAAGLDMDRMVDRVNESLSTAEEDVADAAMDAALCWWEDAVVTAEDWRDQEIQTIALRILDIEDMPVGGIEDQDGIEIAKGDLAQALRAAYEVGRKAGRAEVK
jgi:hypothetical protein